MQQNYKKKSNSPQNKKHTTIVVYTYCFSISCLFFILFGFNSPIYKFNPQCDYQWFITMGRGLLAGKIPYRDLFEQKGPLVYFITAFCCLFPVPNLIMLLIEIICMSLFLYFSYRICIKRLSIFKSLLAISLIITAIFACPNHMYSASTVEEFSLPIYAYFLLCWLEFLLENRNWTKTRVLCLGICFSILLWSKYALLYFIIFPILMWFIINLVNHKYKELVFSITTILVGILIITIPIIIFFAINYGLYDLIHIYFTVNLTTYVKSLTTGTSIFMYLYFCPLILFFTVWGVIRYAILYRHQHGYLILTAFILNFFLIFFTSNHFHYYCQLIPYIILGVTDFFDLIKFKIHSQHLRYLTTVVTILIYIIICAPSNILFTQKIKHETPLIIADVIHKYENQHKTKTSVFCYKIADLGFYNALDIVPDTYYYANNKISESAYPDMYTSFRKTITEHKHDFVITNVGTWYDENDFLSTYYTPYTGNVETSSYHFKQMFEVDYTNMHLILLIKK